MNAHADELRERLDAWVEAGLIRRDQADRIADAEAAGPVGRGKTGAPARRGRAPYVVEALGYLGATLAAIAGFLAVDQLWPDIPIGAQLGFAAAGAVVLTVAAVLIGTPVEAAIGRLRSVLLVLSTGCLAAFTALLAARVWDVGPRGTLLACAAVATGYASGWWIRVVAPLQHMAAYTSATVTAGAAASMLDTDIWWPGVAVWALSAGWALATYRGAFRPQTAGLVGAAVGLLVGAQLTMDLAAGHVLALLTVAGLLAAGVARRQLWLLALGAVGVVQVVPQTAARYLPESAAAPLAVFVVGVLLVGVALWLARSSRIRHGGGV